jgi:RES domain-containing protein
MRGFRIADHRFPILDGRGAKLAGGRWNSPGIPVVYAAETFAGAMLEILVRANLYRMPRTYVFLEILIEDASCSERLRASSLPGWDSDDEVVSRAFGDRWLTEARSAVLVVPNKVTVGVETNILINPLHPDFGKIRTNEPRAVRWDSRLFQENNPRS